MSQPALMAQIRQPPRPPMMQNQMGNQNQMAQSDGQNNGIVGRPIDPNMLAMTQAGAQT